MYLLFAFDWRSSMNIGVFEFQGELCGPGLAYERIIKEFC